MHLWRDGHARVAPRHRGRTTPGSNASRGAVELPFPKNSQHPSWGAVGVVMDGLEHRAAADAGAEGRAWEALWPSGFCLPEVSPSFTELLEPSTPGGGTKNPHPAPFLASWESLLGENGQC